jgi:hypothetical protein
MTSREVELECVLQRIDELLAPGCERVRGTSAEDAAELRREHAARAPVTGSALARAVDVFHLTPAERDAVVLALAPELDDRYGRIFAAIGGGLASRRPTVGLVASLVASRGPDADTQVVAAALEHGAHLERTSDSPRAE